MNKCAWSFQLLVFSNRDHFPVSPLTGSLYKTRRSMIKSTKYSMTSSDYWYIQFESLFQCCLLSDVLVLSILFLSWNGCYSITNWRGLIFSCLHLMQQTKKLFSTWINFSFSLSVSITVIFTDGQNLILVPKISSNLWCKFSEKEKLLLNFYYLFLSFVENEKYNSNFFYFFFMLFISMHTQLK